VAEQTRLWAPFAESLATFERVTVKVLVLALGFAPIAAVIDQDVVGSHERGTLRSQLCDGPSGKMTPSPWRVSSIGDPPGSPAHPNPKTPVATDAATLNEMIFRLMAFSFGRARLAALSTPVGAQCTGRAAR
jgi:hypothetical protein